jgi:argininosuccinate lyase
MKLWEKNYKLNKKIENFTVGNDNLIDQNLIKYDCIASIAHAKMLEKIKVLSKEECKKITTVLNEIITLDKKGLFQIEKEDEDSHTAIEKYLVKKLGDTGKKIHTARSRNDQVLTALRLFYKDQIIQINKSINNLIKSLESFKKKYGIVKIPGYTHMRKAMPSSVSMWTDAFIESMNDNKKLMNDFYSLIDQSPLGTGAGYGVPIDIDRKFTSDLLKFKKVQKNPIYVQNSRGKFESTILHGLSQIMFDLNKMASDLIFFSVPEIGYIQLSDEICTGSSIMPHKKNPDVLELIRANYHKISSYEVEVKNIAADLISGYNRDIQLTKKPVIDGFKLTEENLEIMTIVIENLILNTKKCKEAMTEELYTAEKTYKKVKKGKPFRDAYKEFSEEYFTK